MPEGETIRAFLALDLPTEVLHEIADIQGALKKNIRGAVSWVRPEGIHLTLKFFGDLAVKDVSAVSEVVAGQAAGARPLNLEAKGLGVFPGLRRPRVLWFGIGGEVERLIAIQKAVDQGLGAHGFPREERPFRAHLTLARIKSPQGLRGLDDVLAAKGSESAGKFTATGLALIKSDLTPKGAIYTTLGHFPFQG
ncbi:MAG: RNA 2',3'-cyclic phosphodiesterase [Pseudomonadota bacterium]